jgi:hypothetical protein
VGASVASMPYTHNRDPDDPVAALALRQHGLITRPQLLGLGLGTAAITYRFRHRELFRVHQGVYAVGRPPGTPVERAAAAVMACGKGAALSHGSALSLWGFVSDWRTPLHVTCADRRRRPGIVTHRASGLTGADTRIQLGIAVTSPARTFLDCAEDLGLRRLARLAATARRSGHLHLGQVADLLGRFPGHSGSRLLLEALEGLGQPTRSEFEDAFLAFCQRYELPTPQVNQRVAGREVDMLFAEQRVIVELDGWDFHRDRYAFEDDRERDANGLAAGFVTLRVTWGRLTTSAGLEARRLRAILDSRGLTSPA